MTPISPFSQRQNIPSPYHCFPMPYTILSKCFYLKSKSPSISQPASTKMRSLYFCQVAIIIWTKYQKGRGPLSHSFSNYWKPSPNSLWCSEYKLSEGQRQLSYVNHTVKYNFLQFLGSLATVELTAYVCLYLLCLHLFSHPGLCSFTVKEMSGRFFKGNGKEWFKEKMILDRPEKVPYNTHSPCNSPYLGHTIRSKVVSHKLFTMLN